MILTGISTELTKKWLSLTSKESILEVEIHYCQRRELGLANSPRARFIERHRLVRLIA
jgi:hypothetical protein